MPEWYKQHVAVGSPPAAISFFATPRPLHLFAAQTCLTTLPRRAHFCAVVVLKQGVAAGRRSDWIARGGGRAGRASERETRIKARASFFLTRLLAPLSPSPRPPCSSKRRWRRRTCTCTRPPLMAATRQRPQLVAAPGSCRAPPRSPPPPPRCGAAAAMAAAVVEVVEAAAVVDEAAAAVPAAVAVVVGAVVRHLPP